MKNCKRCRTVLQWAAVTAVIPNPFRLSAPRSTVLILSIQRLDDEAHPGPDVPFCHGHHEDGRLTTDPRALAFWRHREFEMLHKGRDDDQHFQDAIQQKLGGG